MVLGSRDYETTALELVGPVPDGVRFSRRIMTVWSMRLLIHLRGGGVENCHVDYAYVTVSTTNALWIVHAK
jgi:hypothetical protein